MCLGSCLWSIIYGNQWDANQCLAINTWQSMPAREGLFALPLSKVFSARVSLPDWKSQSIVWTPYRHADNNLLATDHTVYWTFRLANELPLTVRTANSNMNGTIERVCVNYKVIVIKTFAVLKISDHFLIISLIAIFNLNFWFRLIHWLSETSFRTELIQKFRIKTNSGELRKASK